ncbi:MAG: hypothetical protein LDL06_04180 [Candidatus Nitrosotenuis sp.]|nr:hypothetical protein [Candidatus Nitrosotenuis sp.]
MTDKKKISIFLAAMIIFSNTTMIGTESAKASHYSGGTVVPCEITVQTNILPVYHDGLSSPRNNPDRTYYPGDAFHFVIQYAGSDTCRNFTVHPLQSSGGITVTDHKGANQNSFAGYSDRSRSNYQSSHPFESPQSVAVFERTAQQLCSQNAGVNAGCVLGHAEIAITQDELNQIHCITNERTKSKVCSKIENKITLTVSGQKKICITIGNAIRCFWVTVSRTASFTPSILHPNIAISVTKENLTDSDGYTIRNLDGTYYLWDAINVIHKPIYRWQNERGGTLETVTTKKYDITNEKEFECQKKSAGTCDYTLEHSHVQSWNKVFDHGAGLTIYNGTSDKDLGRHFFQYKIDLFNIGRYLNTTSGSTDALIVRYDPVYQNYAYNMLKDDHWWAYGNRPAVALHYYGSIGGGPDDSSGIHELRRSKLNGFDYSGYAFDPVNKVFLNETMTWNSAKPITMQSITFDDRCNKEINFDPSSFEVEGDNTSSEKDSAMFVKSGYGKIIFSYPILGTILKERFHDVTIENTLQSIHFGGRDISNVTDYHYTYPRVKFHTSVKVIAYNSEGQRNQIPVSIVMNPQFDKGAEYTQDYICKKIFYDTQDEGFSDIVLDDMYGKDVNKKNGTGYVNLKSSLTSTYFPNYTGVFFGNISLGNNSSLDKSQYKNELDIPLNFGFGALSPYDITITAGDKSRTFDAQTFQFYSNHLFIVNLDQDNILNVTRNQNNQNLVTINYDENFGPIEQVFVSGKEYERRCRTGCSIIIPDNEVTLEAYNVWGGRAVASLDPMEPGEEGIKFDDSSIIWYAILGLIAGIVLWKESKRILRWLGFSTID